MANTNWGSGPVNINWGPGSVNTNLVPGSVNTRWGPGPVNTNWRPGPGARVGGRGWGPGPRSRAKDRAGDKEIQTAFFTPEIIRKTGFLGDYYNGIRSLKFAHSDKAELGDKL